MVCSDKRLVLFAGANGTGKSTLYNIHPEYRAFQRVNSDEIAQTIGDWRDTAVQLQAARIAVTKQNECLMRGCSFTQETTLCGHSIILAIRKARQLGFRTELHYIGVNSVEICKDRIRRRVLAGGHGIPDDVVERRYRESFAGLKRVLPLCDEISFYDNSEAFSLLAHYETGSFSLLSKELPDWFVNLSIEQKLF